MGLLRKRGIPKLVGFDRVPTQNIVLDAFSFLVGNYDLLSSTVRRFYHHPRADSLAHILGLVIIVPAGFQAQWREHSAEHGVPKQGVRYTAQRKVPRFGFRFALRLFVVFIRPARPAFGRPGGRTEGQGRPDTYTSPKCMLQAGPATYTSTNGKWLAGPATYTSKKCT